MTCYLNGMESQAPPLKPQTQRTQPRSDRTIQEKKQSGTYQSITINSPRSEVFAYWRDLENLPSFMTDLTSVEILTTTRSKWVVTLKSGQSVEWEAEITAERHGEMMLWSSIEGSQVETSGAIYFSDASAGRGTVVELEMSYRVPGGKLGELMTKLSGEDPKSLARTNLRRLKAILETGEIATIQGQPSGREELIEKPIIH